MMNDHILLLLNICYLGLGIRIAYLWLKGISDAKSALESFKIIFVFVIGTSFAAFVVKITGAQMEQIEGLSCQKVSYNLWSCGGWPAIWDYYVNILYSLKDNLLSFMALPSMTAPLIANLYLARKVVDVEKLDEWDLVRAFGGSFGVFFLLTHVPYVLGGFEALAEKMMGVNNYLDEGRENLKQWVEVLNMYVSTLDSFTSFSFPYLLFLTASLFALIINFGSTTLYIHQMLLVSLVPMAFLKAILSDKNALLVSIRSLAGAAFLGLLNGPMWLFLSVLPTLQRPEIIRGTLVYGDYDYYKVSGILFFCSLLFFIYYLILFLSTIRIVGKIFTLGGD